MIAKSVYPIAQIRGGLVGDYYCRMMKGKMIMALMVPMMSFGGMQPFGSMTWFNEPEKWAVENGTLTMRVTGQSDYWRVSHYGFTVDDGPFLYAERGGESEAKVKVTGAYKDRFDQAGLMLRIDHENWIKAGIEFVEIPRMEVGGEPVSAKRVRSLLGRNLPDELRRLVPDTTFDYLAEKELI